MLRAIITALLLSTAPVQMQINPALPIAPPAAPAPDKDPLLAPESTIPDAALLDSVAERVARGYSEKSHKKIVVDAVLYSLGTEGRWAFVVFKGPGLCRALTFVWEEGKWKPLDAFVPVK